MRSTGLKDKIERADGWAERWAEQVMKNKSWQEE
jgi:hypothetical protein